MYNIILDKLPSDYEGYLIRTSFRIGMQICMCLNDNEYTEEERLTIALNLLYGKSIPSDLSVAIAGLQWFLSCGNVPKNQPDNHKTLFYWDFDSSRLYSSFMQTFNIDITNTDMHWFKFIALMGSLNKDSAFNKAVEIRDYDMQNLKGKSRQELMKLKHSLTPEVEYSDEEKAQIEKFDKLLNEGDVNG